VRRTSDFLEKATWGLAGLLLILSLMSAPKTTTIVNEDGTTEQTGGDRAATKDMADPNRGGNTNGAAKTPTSAAQPGK
jgi:hypothetical protein